MDGPQIIRGRGKFCFGFQSITRPFGYSSRPTSEVRGARLEATREAAMAAFAKRLRA
jgi:hypothetical protein